MRTIYPLVILSSLLLSLAFHPIGIYFLAWFSLVPLLFIIENAKPSLAFKTGIIFGFLFSLFSLFWLVFLQIESNIKTLMVFGLVVLFLYIGLYFGVSFLIANKIGVWFLPFIISGLEFVRGSGELGFPWLSLGYSQARYPVIIQQASIYGIYGLSFWLVLLNVTLYKMIKDKRVKNLILTILIIFLPIIFGILRTKPNAQKYATIGIIQPNIDPNLKFSRAIREETFNRLILLSLRCIENSLDQYAMPCDLIIWPETAIPIFLKASGEYQERVFEFSNKTSAPIFSGTPLYNYKTHEIYNGAVLIEPGNRIVQEYKKLHLVPFGEHIPFDRHVPLFRKIDLGEGDYTSGTEYTIFSTNTFTFSCLICFESIFSELSRAFVYRGAELLVNITNDGWFGKISGSQQHNDMAILRTVENGVPMARCANNGISMIVDAYGRILKETPLFVEDFIMYRVPMNNIKTIYRVLGDILPILSLILIPVLLIRPLIIAKFI